MNEYKTIREVLKRGHISITFPVYLMLIVIPILILIICTFFFTKDVVNIISLIVVVSSIILSWVWWSYKIVKWRIWAFTNTRDEDWIELKNKAIKENLLWGENSFFGKTEIRSKSEQEIINKIENIIRDKEDENIIEVDFLEKIGDDSSIPERLEYSYPFSEAILSVILPITLIAIGIYIILSENKLLIGLLVIGWGIYLTNINKIKSIWKKEVQFSISNEGIDIKKFKQFGFIKWDNTQDISVDTENGILYLKVWEKEVIYEITFNLNDYEIRDYSDFLRKINVYLKRNLNKGNDS